jgi:hypothetical protein
MSGPTPLDWQIFLEASTIYSNFSGHDDRPFDCAATKQADGTNIAASLSRVSRQNEVSGVSNAADAAECDEEFNYREYLLRQCRRADGATTLGDLR